MCPLSSLKPDSNTQDSGEAEWSGAHAHGLAGWPPSSSPSPPQSLPLPLPEHLPLCLQVPQCCCPWSSSLGFAFYPSSSSVYCAAIPAGSPRSTPSVSVGCAGKGVGGAAGASGACRQGGQTRGVAPLLKANGPGWWEGRHTRSVILLSLGPHRP